jgi:hypothetical protein
MGWQWQTTQAVTSWDKWQLTKKATYQAAYLRSSTVLQVTNDYVSYDGLNLRLKSHIT